MDAFLAQAKALVKTADEAGRKKILDTLREVSYSLESPQDSAQRIMYLQLMVPMVRVGCDLNLFNILAESPTPLTVEALSQTTGTAPTLLGRILRYLASNGVIKETDKDTFTKNSITETFTLPGFAGGIYHYHDSIGPAIQALPDFLKETKYQDITSVVNTPLQKAWNTELPAFIWVQTKSENFAHFNQFMANGRLGMPTWLDAYPYKEKAEGLKPEQPLFIDLGGGIGHQAIALREKLPDLPNKIVLQDIPQTLEHAIKHPGVEVVVQDFFQPQAITGARIYYMRNIIHDYPEDKAILILKNTIAAMAPDSVILIDDMVLPDSGVHWQATQIDLIMMTALASQERTREQWYDLLGMAGLKINKVYTYTASLQDSIIEAVPA
ncbi:S-adenosyl-L-methionine-dependent methyltransferase [Lipomyces starkeyi]